MKKLFLLLIISFSLLTTYTKAGDYTLVVEGYDWGAAVSKVILSMEVEIAKVNAQNYQILVKKSSVCAELSPAEASGELSVIRAYVSDAKGNAVESGKYATLVVFVSPFESIGSPVKYFPRSEKCRGNQWVDYHLTVLDKMSHQVWNRETDRIIPLIDEFDLTGRFTYEDKITMSYAFFKPKSTSEKSPLIIWLHGGGEGGTDASIPLIANRAANYASPEIQAYFGGAYVLSPQSPTFWMDNGKGGYTRGEVNDRYNEALMALFRDFVAKHPDIDQNRIYVGGCSNGGYMTLKLILQHPDYFAAGFPSALAYASDHITDKQMKSIKHVPIWFVHAKDDPVTIPEDTAVPVYNRLMKAGAKNVHFSYFDHVVDISGLFGGNQHHYNGHWSWIYSHANKCQLDYDGKPVKVDGRAVTLMEWLAAQKLK